MLNYLLFSLILINLKFNFSCGKSVCSLCHCSEDILDCSNKAITVVPSDFKNGNKSTMLFEHNSIINLHQLPPLKVGHLSFSFNSLAHIDDSAFKNLYNLSTLDLSNNYLTLNSLMPNVFKGNYLPDMYEPLRGLKELNLGNNLIHSLHFAVFEHLPNLEKLILSRNPLKVLSQGIINALSSLPRLKELYLSNNSLKVLPENVFHGPKYLEILDLSYNKFVETPIQLENTHSLRWLSLSGNPIVYIENFPVLPFLRTLHLSKMPELIAIKNRSLSSLALLEEFYCADNRKLVKISKDTFSALSSHDEEGELWPPLKVLVLKNNALRYIESHLVSRWESLTTLNLQQNPWMCDCENQWLVSTLTPIIQKITPEMLNSFQCSEPVEMKNRLIVDLYVRSYEMRCLDVYNHTPEHDGKLLIDILILSIISAPIIMAALIYYKRKRRISIFRVLKELLISSAFFLPKKFKYTLFTNRYYTYRLVVGTINKLFITSSTNNARCSGPRNKRNVAIVKLSNETLPCQKIEKPLMNTKQFYVVLGVLLIATTPSIFIVFLCYSKVTKRHIKYQHQYEMCEYSRIGDKNMPIECSSLHF